MHIYKHIYIYINTHNHNTLIVIMEKPPIIDERLNEVGRGAASKIAKRMGYLKLFTYGSAIGLGVYFALVHEYNHPLTGKPYEHVFSPLRRVFWRNMDGLLGVNNGDDDNTEDRYEAEKKQIIKNHIEHMKARNPAIGKVKDTRFTPEDLKKMKESGMTVPEIQKIAQERYDKFRMDVRIAQQARDDAYNNQKKE